MDSKLSPTAMLGLAAVALLIIGVMVSKSGGGGGGSYGYTAISPSKDMLNYSAQVYNTQAQTTVQLAEISAAREKNQLDSSNVRYAVEQSTALQRYQTDAAVSMNRTNTQAAVQLGQISADTQIRVNDRAAQAQEHAAASKAQSDIFSGFFGLIGNIIGFFL